MNDKTNGNSQSNVELTEVFAIPVREGNRRTTIYTETLLFVPGPGVELDEVKAENEKLKRKLLDK